MTMPDPGGALTISIHRSTAAVRIASTRPLGATRVFIGKPVAEVAARLPLLYSICATAQATACVRASEQLLGLTPAPAVSVRRRLLLLAETAKEHLWRLLLDWPRALTPVTGGPAVDEAALATALRAYLTLRRAMTDADSLQPGARALTAFPSSAQAPLETLLGVARQRVFGEPPGEWLRLAASIGGLARWAQKGKTGPASLVYIISRSNLADLGRNPVPAFDLRPDDGVLDEIRDALAAANADAFVGRPSIGGRAHETTPLAREVSRHGLVAELVVRHGNGLLPRLGALLMELARTLAVLETALDARTSNDFQAAWDTATTSPLVSGSASAAVAFADAARGLLVHRLEGEDDRVRGYRILAPTEWNFHPDGVVVQGLAAIARDLPSSADEASLRDRAVLYVTAVDPCVPYRLVIDSRG